jgi:hypothetical protein
MREIARKIAVLLVFPIVTALWLLGWVCYVVGERKEAKT